MPALKKIFAVIDPTTDNQIALTRAGKIAGRNENVSIHVFEAIHRTGNRSDPEALQRVETVRHQAWLETYVTPLREAGLEVVVEIEWTPDWKTAVARAAERADASIIIKAAKSRGSFQRRLLRSADWTLLRNAPCPVYEIKKDEISENIKVLLAVDISRNDDMHIQLNKLVIEYGKILLVGAKGASMFVVNAYPSSSKFVYKDDLATQTGIDPENVFTVEGAPEKVIPEVAEEVEADIVIVGTAARGGVTAAALGSTAERILDAITTNILTVKIS